MNEKKFNINKIFGILSKYDVEEARKRAREIRNKLNEDLDERLRYIDEK